MSGGEDCPRSDWLSKVAERTRFFAYRTTSRVRRALQGVEERWAPEPPQPLPQAAVARAAALLPPLWPPSTTPSVAPAVTVLGHLSDGDFFGGIATVLIVAGIAAEQTSRLLRVACTSGETMGTNESLSKFLAASGVQVEVEIVDVRTPDGVLPLHDDDVLVASSWWDATAVASLDNRRFLYVIQDYEPNFHAQGDRFALASATYRNVRAVPLFNTSVLREWFLSTGHKDLVARGSFFEPARGLTPRSHGEQSRQVFFYGRANVERNLYAMGLLALIDVAADQRSEGWEFFMAGDASAESLTLADGRSIRALGKMTEEAYLTFAAGVSVALTPMLAPHPNYPTLELASLGARVITTCFGSKRDLSRYSPNIRLTEPTAAAMAEAVLEAMGAMSAQDVQAPSEPALLPTDWHVALDQPLQKVLATIMSGENAQPDDAIS